MPGEGPSLWPDAAHRLNRLEMVRHLARRDPAIFGGAGPDAWLREVGLGAPDQVHSPMPD